MDWGSLQNSEQIRSQKNSFEILGYTIWNYSDNLKSLLINHTKNWKTVTTRKNRKTYTYYNHAITFDIETSNCTKKFTDETGKEQEEKFAFMYVWMMDIDGLLIVGRKWDEWISLCGMIAEVLHLNDFQRIAVYVHNLSFEFQFIRKLFNWENIFSLDTRKPARALTTWGIEFRCSYILSGYALANIGSKLTRHKTQKMTGDLDYALIRNSKTPLTETEWGYNIMDVVVLHDYIEEKIEDDGDITKIPMTKTGYIRQLMSKNCLPKGKAGNQYRALMKKLTIGYEEYYMLKKLFAGGFTHASYHNVGKTLEYVGSYDETSEYPSVAVSKYFPMSKGQYIAKPEWAQFQHLLKTKCCGFNIKIEPLKLKTGAPDSPISLSKCWDVQEPEDNNGRLIAAKSVTTTMTELDFATFLDYYDVSRETSIIVWDLYVYDRGYLPREVIHTIMDLYQKKTELKDVAGQEIEYMASKENINSCYGMMVMDPIQELILCNGEEWLERIDKKSQEWKEYVLDSIDKYNSSTKRCLFYPWGIWITAHARRNLFNLIKEMGHDYVYSDTDSGKALNIDKIKPYIEKDNRRIMQEMAMSAKHNGLPFSMYTPKTIEGKEKPMGVWDFEGVYKLFKTLGAKRYMTLKGDVFSITVSGVNKSKCCPRLLEAKGIPYHKDKKGLHIDNLDENMQKVRKIFDEFADGWTADEEASGRLISTYIDDETEEYITDYLGNTEIMREKSSLNLTASTYTMSLKEGYLEYCDKLNELEKIHPLR